VHEKIGKQSQILAVSEQAYDQLADDRMALVSGISLDPEAAVGVTKRSPPRWLDGVDEVSRMLVSYFLFL